MNIFLNPFWENDSMTMNVFANKSGLGYNTIKRWVNNGLSPHAASYLTFCVLLDVSPESLLDSKVDKLCKAHGLTVNDACCLCGFDPFSFIREMTGIRDRIPNSLVQLDKLYKFDGERFDRAFDIGKVRQAAIARLDRISNIVNAA